MDHVSVTIREGETGLVHLRLDSEKPLTEPFTAKLVVAEGTAQHGLDTGGPLVAVFPAGSTPGARAVVPIIALADGRVEGSEVLALAVADGTNTPRDAKHVIIEDVDLASPPPMQGVSVVPGPHDLFGGAKILPFNGGSKLLLFDAANPDTSFSHRKRAQLFAWPPALEAFSFQYTAAAAQLRVAGVEKLILIGGGNCVFVIRRGDRLDLDGQLQGTAHRPPTGGAAVGYLNGDALDDFVIADGAAGNSWEHGTGTCMFFQTEAGDWVRGPTLTTDACVGLGMGDIDEDGRSDVALTRRDGTALVFLSRTDYSKGLELEPGRLIKVRDVDGDRHLDVVVLRENGVALYLGDGKGKLFRAATYHTPGATRTVLADLDGDQLPELLWVVQSGDVHARWNAGAGMFVGLIRPLFTGVTNVHSTEAGDLDGDGADEVVFARGAEATLVLSMNGPLPWQRQPAQVVDWSRAPAFSPSPSVGSVHFAPTPIGMELASGEFYVTAAAPTPIKLSTSAPFNLVPVHEGSGVLLLPGVRQPLEVTFKPTRLGQAHQALKIDSSAGGSVSVDLHGIGVAPPPATPVTGTPVTPRDATPPHGLVGAAATDAPYEVVANHHTPVDGTNLQAAVHRADFANLRVTVRAGRPGRGAHVFVAEANGAPILLGEVPAPTRASIKQSGATERVFTHSHPIEAVGLVGLGTAPRDRTWDGAWAQVHAEVLSGAAYDVLATLFQAVIGEAIAELGDEVAIAFKSHLYAELFMLPANWQFAYSSLGDADRFQKGVEILTSGVTRCVRLVLSGLIDKKVIAKIALDRATALLEAPLLVFQIASAVRPIATAWYQGLPGVETVDIPPAVRVVAPAIGLKLREGPSADSRVLAGLPMGVELEISEYRVNQNEGRVWLAVRPRTTTQHVGWVAAEQTRLP